MELRQFVALIAGMLVGFVNGSIYIFGTVTPYAVTLLRYSGTPPNTQEMTQ